MLRSSPRLRGLGKQHQRADQEAESAERGARVGGEQVERIASGWQHVAADGGDPEQDAAGQVDDRDPVVVGPPRRSRRTAR